MDTAHTVVADAIRELVALLGISQHVELDDAEARKQCVIGLRIAKLMRGGKAAQREAQRMMSEKVLAAAKAGTSLMAGAPGDKIVEQYRRKVAANAKRLSRNRTRRNRK